MSTYANFFIFFYAHPPKTFFVLDAVRGFANRLFPVLSLHPPELYSVLWWHWREWGRSGLAQLGWLQWRRGCVYLSLFSLFSISPPPKNEHLELIYFFIFLCFVLTVVSSQPSPIPSNNIRNLAFVAISSYKTVPEKLQARFFCLSPERKECLGWCTYHQRLDRKRINQGLLFQDLFFLSFFFW